MITLEDSLKLLSYACAPIVTIAALVGLKQLNVSRSIARTQAKREAFRVAGEQCRFYMEVIIPFQNALNQKSQAHLKAINASAECNITSKGYSVSFKSKLDTQGFTLIAKEFLDVFNRMESFAMFFISGVAEERVAYTSIGNTFCDTVKTYLPDLALVDAGKDSYKNLMHLFTIWNARLEEEKLRKEKLELDKKLNAIERKTIATIGSE